MEEFNEQTQQQDVTQDQQTESTEIRFIDDAEVEAARQGLTQEEQPAPYEQQETQQDFSTEETQQQNFSEQEIEGAVFNFLSERLGRDVRSFDDLRQQEQQQREIDERVLAIADFVEKTGRNPQDWFYYQSLNPSEMDDTTAIQVQMISEYPNLSQEEISILISSKYKLDPNLHTEDEVKLSQLQLKIDAENARRVVSNLRDQYAAPEPKQNSYDPIVNDEWIGNMKAELSTLEGVEFDLGNGKTFNFGINDRYKSQLADKNSRLDEFFDSYVRKDGSWDYDMLNVHQAVIDNIDSIVQSVYRQGMADGQRGLVNNAANVQYQSPNQGGAPQTGNPLAQQLREILGINGR